MEENTLIPTCHHCRVVITGVPRAMIVNHKRVLFCPTSIATVAPDCANEFLKKAQQTAQFSPLSHLRY